ncbi:MAG: hypothetical protein HOV83_23815, partial [Catenulispora sp.]|nr:hypothetical protein [Catenulispora sp.]
MAEPVTGSPAAVDAAGVTPPAASRPAPASNARVGLIVGGVAVALIAGFALGKATTGAGAAPTGTTPNVSTTFNESMPHTHANMGMTGSEVGGLSINMAGYTLVPRQTAYAAGEQTFSFVITGPDGKPATT